MHFVAILAQECFAFTAMDIVFLGWDPQGRLVRVFVGDAGFEGHAVCLYADDTEASVQPKMEMVKPEEEPDMERLQQQASTRLPQAVTGCYRLSQAATDCHRLPQDVTGCHRLPQAVTG